MLPSRWLSSACALLSVGVLSITAYAADTDEKFRVERVDDGCGAYAVAMMLYRAGQGQHVGYSDVAAITDPDGDGSCSIREVVAALRHFGMRNIEARASDTRVLPRGRGIIRVSSRPDGSPASHFLYIEPMDTADKFIVYEIPWKVSEWSSAALSQCWSGEIVMPMEGRSSTAVPWVVLAFVSFLCALAVSRVTKSRGAS